MVHNKSVSCNNLFYLTYVNFFFLSGSFLLQTWYLHKIVISIAANSLCFHVHSKSAACFLLTDFTMHIYPSGPPGQPAGVHVHSKRGTEVTLWWQPGMSHGEAITLYRIEFRNNFNPTWQMLVDGKHCLALNYSCFLFQTYSHSEFGLIFYLTEHFFSIICNVSKVMVY